MGLTAQGDLDFTIGPAILHNVVTITLPQVFFVNYHARAHLERAAIRYRVMVLTLCKSL